MRLRLFELVFGQARTQRFVSGPRVIELAPAIPTQQLAMQRTWQHCRQQSLGR